MQEEDKGVGMGLAIDVLHGHQGCLTSISHRVPLGGGYSPLQASRELARCDPGVPGCRLLRRGFACDS